MSNNIGTLVTSPIRPHGIQDTFPSAHANELLGGHHQVTLLVERNAISLERRLIGMTCYVQEAAVTYQLIGGLLDTNWEVFNTGSGGSVQIPYKYIDEEYPTIDLIDNRKFTLSKSHIGGSLKVYQEGIRLRAGITNDYTILSTTEFRINDEKDYDPSDIIIVDYRTSL
jgi:hypothetical protein